MTNWRMRRHCVWRRWRKRENKARCHIIMVSKYHTYNSTATTTTTTIGAAATATTVLLLWQAASRSPHNNTPIITKV